MRELQSRSLDRGITILETLATSGAMSLAGLHHATGLPKSTIRRLLATLVERRLVRRPLSDRKYHLNISLAVAPGMPLHGETAALADEATPVLIALTQKIKWPSDLHVIDGNAMRLVDSTRPLSPYMLFRGLMDVRLNMFGCATGIACLAAMAEDEIRRRMRETEGQEGFHFARFGMTEEQLFRRLAETRAKGYGQRLPVYTGETTPDDGMAAIAVPLMRSGRPVGGITVLFPRDYRKLDDLAGLYLADLTEAARVISERFEAAGGR